MVYCGSWCALMVCAESCLSAADLYSNVVFPLARNQGALAPPGRARLPALASVLGRSPGKQSTGLFSDPSHPPWAGAFARVASRNTGGGVER
jgi:hypothetical protein